MREHVVNKGKAEARLRATDFAEMIINTSFDAFLSPANGLSRDPSLTPCSRMELNSRARKRANSDFSDILLLSLGRSAAKTCFSDILDQVLLRPSPEYGKLVNIP